MTTCRFVPIPSRPFVTFDLDAGVADDFAALTGYVNDGNRMVGEPIVRVRYTATEEQARRIDQHAIRQALLDAGASHVTIEPEIVREDRARVHIDTDTLTELDALGLWLDTQGVNGERGALMVERTQRYLEQRA